MTFKRRVRPPRPQLVAFPLVGLRPRCLSAVASLQNHGGCSPASFSRGSSLCALVGDFIQSWPIAGPLPLSFPPCFFRKAAWVAVVTCQDLFVLLLWAPCLFLSVANHSLTPSAPVPTFIVNFLTASETFPFCQTGTNLAVPSRPECEPPNRTKKISCNNFVFLLILYFKITPYSPLGLSTILSLIMTFLGCPKSSGNPTHLYLCRISKAQHFANSPHFSLCLSSAPDLLSPCPC